MHGWVEGVLDITLRKSGSGDVKVEEEKKKWEEFVVVVGSGCLCLERVDMSVQRSCDDCDNNNNNNNNNSDARRREEWSGKDKVMKNTMMKVTRNAAVYGR